MPARDSKPDNRILQTIIIEKEQYKQVLKANYTKFITIE